MMSKVFFIALLALVALVAVVSARPIIYTATQLDTNLPNTTNGWRGVAYSFLTITKGRNNHRFRIFGTYNINNLNDTVTSAWIVYANQTKVAEIGIPVNTSFFRYFVGDVRINSTVFEFLMSNDLGVTVYTQRFPNGAISGLFHARPNTALTQLNGGSVVPPADNNQLGYGLTYIADSDNLPLDLVQQTNAILNNASFDAIIIHNVTGATSATFNTANSTSVGPVLANIPLGSEGSAYGTHIQPVTSDFYSQQFGFGYLQVNSATFPNGAIRGQLLPTLGRTRRAIPTEATTITGITSAPNGFETLRFPNMQGNERNDNSFISLSTTQANSTSNFTYQGFFSFPAAASRRNYNNVRGYSLELNLRQFGTGTWNFDYFDATTGVHVPTATFSSPGLWTVGVANYYQHDASTFNNNRGELVIRITANWPTSTTLWVDLMGLRSYEPYAFSNIVFKEFIVGIGTIPFQLGSQK